MLFSIILLLPCILRHLPFEKEVKLNSLPSFVVHQVILYQVSIIIQQSMGGSQSTHIQVENITPQDNKQIQPEPIKQKSPKKSPHVAKSPNKVTSAKQKSSSDLLSGNTVVSVAYTDLHTQEASEAKTKKKIKSQRKLPTGLHKQVVEQVVAELTSSSRYDRKAQNQKQDIHKLMRIYDLG